MEKPKKILFLSLFLLGVLTQGSLMADERKDAWYETTSGEYWVMESIHGVMFASLHEAQDGDPNIFFKIYSPDHCRHNGERTLNHDPVSINGTLVQMSQHCRGEWNNFYPPTREGRNYVINQFKHSRSVTIEHDNFTFIFSAMGFIDYYNKFNRNLNAL